MRNPEYELEYRFYNEDDGEYYYVKNNIVYDDMGNETNFTLDDVENFLSVGKSTPYKDVHGSPLFTTDVVMHFNSVYDPNRYDIGIIYESETGGVFYRSTLFPEYDKFLLSDKCKYVHISNGICPRSVAAYMCWHHLPFEIKQKYYCTSGVLGFLKDFTIRKDEHLTDEEIESALNSIDGFYLVVDNSSEKDGNEE